MCGIAGLLAAPGAPVDERALAAMTAALAHRGPDGEGLLVEPPVGLGHRRLAIIDLHGGAQPLESADGAVALTFNGELYNYRELRAELVAGGAAFRTASDSEVVAAAVARWGDDSLTRLDGMFAFAAWDRRTRTLLLARDRFGEKPLYLAQLDDGSLAFASELRALVRHPRCPRAVDPAALLRYLVYEYVPSPRTILAGVTKLEPGELARVAPGRPPVRRRYWELAFPRERRPLDPGALAEELEGSVRRRLVADVPVGLFLSGGLDSSAIAVAAAGAGAMPASFALGFEERSFDERGPARRVAEALSLDHHERLVGPAEVLALVPALERLLDEPLGDASLVPTHLLARFARERVKVALSGDGGDELFLGYPTFQAERLAGLLWDRAPSPLRRAAAALARRLPVSTANFSLDFKLKQFLRGEGERGPRRHQRWLGSMLPDEARAALAPELGAALAGDDPLSDVDARMAGCAATDPWDRLGYFYARFYLGEDVLAKVDRATMAAGLEARAPLLDPRLVAHAAALGPGDRLHGLTTKWALRRALAGRLPRAIVARPKKGFGMPVGRWLRGPLRELLRDELAPDKLRREGLLDPLAVGALVEAHLCGRADHRKPLWTLLAFERWLAGHAAGGA